MDEKFCLLFVQNSYNEIRFLSLFKKKINVITKEENHSPSQLWLPSTQIQFFLSY